MPPRGIPSHRPRSADPPPSSSYVTTPQHDSPSACASFRVAADATVDGAEPAYVAAAGDAHAQRCPACHAWLEARQAYRRRLRSIGDAFRAPEALRERIRALLRAAPGITDA